jgi:hypothetical protein
MIIRGNKNSKVIIQVKCKNCYSLNENVIHSYKLLEEILVIEIQSNFYNELFFE